MGEILNKYSKRMDEIFDKTNKEMEENFDKMIKLLEECLKKRDENSNETDKVSIQDESVKNKLEMADEIKDIVENTDVNNKEWGVERINSEMDKTDYNFNKKKLHNGPDTMNKVIVSDIDKFITGYSRSTSTMHKQSRKHVKRCYSDKRKLIKNKVKKKLNRRLRLLQKKNSKIKRYHDFRI